VVNSGGLVSTLDSSGGTVTLHLAGVPNFPYAVERAASPGGPWSVIHTTNAPATGVFIFTDMSPPMPSAYYRMKYNP